MHRAPPENQTAPRMSRGGDMGLMQDDRVMSIKRENKRSLSLYPDDRSIIFTTIPANDRWWKLKAVSSDGEVAYLPACFPSRLAALGAAVLLAKQCNGRVRP
jgi:hypothetical protein